MKLVHAVDELRSQVDHWRGSGERVALVPTMGNLHSGHIALVEHARGLAPRTLVSVFVNPLQFGPAEDFGAYPRTLEADAEKLDQAGADLLFAPGVSAMYRRPADQQTRVEVPGVSDILCGASRPGHFVGVATVVCKLLNQVRPDLAVFGEKDFQQLLVIRRMAEDLDMGVEIIGHPTVREADGLAMSSRNGYLTAEQRERAPVLYRALSGAKQALGQGRRDFGAIESEASAMIEAAGLRPDYVSVRRAEDLGLPSAEDRDLVVLAAAYLGKARLIDNLSIEI